MRDTTIDRAQQGPLEAWSRFNPFNNLVRNVEMKSTDRKILILVASLALLLAGCGGGGPSTAPPDPGQTADMAIMDAKDALTAAEAAASAAMTEDAKLAAYREVQRAADNLVAALTTHGGSEADIAAAAGKSGNAGAMADNLAQKIEDDVVAADTAMTALAAKLYTAIGPYPFGGDPAGNFFDPSGVDTGISNTGVLTVHNISDNVPRASTGPQLKEDKSTMVPPLHGWTGSRHTATVAAGTLINPGNSDDGDIGAGTYTAHLYSDVGDPEEGAKFNSAGLTETTAGSGIYTVPAGNSDRIASPEFDHTAGDKTYKVPDNPPTWKEIDGSYWGVEGTYRCTYGGNDCTVTKAAKGYTLGGGTWTFIPDNPEDRVTSLPDTVYPVYGWWLHEALDGTTTVSAFTDYRGSLTEQQAELANLSTDENAAPAAAVHLNGTATYKGGAAGFYALQSSTGGTNDAGHFTADAELTATFKEGGIGSVGHKITGTIDNFMGSDGMSRDWSVALNEVPIAADGRWPDTSLNPNKTIWSVGGTAAGEAGEWGGRLYKQNDGGVPTVGTGRFYSEYENAGRMVGAFGVNLEE